MKKQSARFFDSDLAEERHKASFKNGGVDFEVNTKNGVQVSRLTVTSQEGAKAIGRGEGQYITVSFPFFLPTAFDAVSLEIQDALRALFPKTPSRLLVAGLGNRRLTADSIGVRCAEKVLSSSRTGVFIPRTFGETGIESADLLRSAVETFAPDGLIVIDALAARDRERLLCAIELCDTGIIPGSGISNKRTPITRETMGVPTIAIGIPTVMRAQSFLKRAEAKRRYIDAAKDLLIIPPNLEEGIHTLSTLIGGAVNNFSEEVNA